mgnify:CR=1 FL=1
MRISIFLICRIRLPPLVYLPISVILQSVASTEKILMLSTRLNKSAQKLKKMLSKFRIKTLFLYRSLLKQSTHIKVLLKKTIKQICLSMRTTLRFVVLQTIFWIDFKSILLASRIKFLLSRPKTIRLMVVNLLSMLITS